MVKKVSEVTQQITTCPFLNLNGVSSTTHYDDGPQANQVGHYFCENCPHNHLCKRKPQ